MLEAIKVQVTPEQSRIIQELAFKQGYKWYDGTKVKTDIGHYLYLSSNSTIQHGTIHDTFTAHGDYVLYEAEYLIQNSSEVSTSRSLNRIIS